MSELAQQLIAENKAKHARGEDASYLDLGNCGLTELPDLSGMEWLETLILSRRWWEVDVEQHEWIEIESQNPADKIYELYITSHDKMFIEYFSPSFGNNRGNNNVLFYGPLASSLPLSLKKLVLCNCIVFDGGSLQNLTQLTSLFLSFNHISDFSFLQNLTQLTSLSLGSNGIVDCSFLQKLNHLTSLDISRNQISDATFLQHLPQLTSLNLSYNLISNCRFLKNLTMLTSLDISNNQVRDATFLQHLPQLTSLNLSYNPISDCYFLKKLIRITVLDISSNEISDVSFLGKLTRIKSLNISNNQISNVMFLQHLTQLTSLNLSNNEISDCSSIEKLTGLTTLDISGNNISNWSFFEKLTGLKILTIIEGELKDCSFLQYSIQLTSLNLSENQISDGRFLEKLTGLTSLDLSENQISDIRFLEKLIRLTLLGLSENKISDIRFLENLTGLTWLHLSNNQISDVRFLEKLTGLTELDLSRNQISDVGPIKCLRHLAELHLEGNPIQYVPQEIYSKYDCAEALFDYFDALDLGQKVTDRQLKIIFLGNGCTGKTTLLHWFLDNEFKDLSLEQARTHGVIIQPYLFERRAILGNFWDFGGQEIYHATHRLFMGRRSMYILMWAKETPENEEETRHLPQYWLDMIADLTESGERSRVLIVQNQFSDEPELDIFESNEQREDYRKQGLDISTYFINAKTGENVDILKMVVEKEAEKQIEANVAELPETWAAIRKKVTELRHVGQKTLTFQEFEGISETAKLTTSKVNLLNYLHSAGELFYYENRFHNQIILDQQWALDAVYAILKKNKIERYGGIFTVEDLREIWRSTHTNLSEREANVFLNFMLANEIAFRLDNRYWEEDSEQKLVVPQLLGISPPPRRATWNRVPDKLRHRIDYRFLHRSIIERFMAKTGELSRQYEFWRQGLFINLNNDDEALIEVCEEDGKRFIQVECVGSGRVHVLQKIRKEFHNIRSLDNASEFQFDGRQWQPFDEKIMPGEKSGFSERELRYFSEKNEDKTIRIFLASSAELAEDRKEFEIFINRENKNLRAKSLFIDLVLWEDFLDAVSATRLQDEYNKALRGCDIVVCLFYTKVGKYTAEEFDAALGHFRETGKPHIFTYFKDTPTKPSELLAFDTVLEFKKRLSELGHFHNHYESLGDLKHHFGEQLKKLGLG